jgi:hypothetical protein
MRHTCTRYAISPATRLRRATARPAGRLVDLLADEREWALRLAVVDTSRPLSRKSLVATERIREVSWIARRIRIDVTAEQLRTAPEMDPHDQVDAAEEARLYAHYGRLPGRSHVSERSPPTDPEA